jgi:hypothetical protein
MPVIEAQCASILVPHDHRHINHESTPGQGHVKACSLLSVGRQVDVPPPALHSNPRDGTRCLARTYPLSLTPGAR